MPSHEYNQYNQLFDETPDTADDSEFIRHPAKWVREHIRQDHKTLWLQAKIANPHWTLSDVLAYALVGTDFAAALLSDDIENQANDRLAMMGAITVRPPGTPAIKCIKHRETNVPEGAACPDCIAYMLELRPNDMTEADALVHINKLVSTSILAHEMRPGEQVH